MVKHIKILFFAVFFIYTNINYAKAVEDILWYEDRDEAFAIAIEQNKNVLLLYGRNTCNNCNAVKNIINQAPINQIVNDNFILWFCNIDIVDKRAQGADYRDYYYGGITLPMLCVIDPEQPLPALSYATGRKNAEQIQTILTNDLPTSNTEISATINRVYLSDGMMTISNNYSSERVYIYTTDGKLIDFFDKNETAIIKSAYAYPKGILFITSSKGWSFKLYNRH